ncbi:MAG: alkaline phosphatase family protein [Actinomycetota bacterium]|nr:alkaline phosphatase family protein [Actinomycetota bacterium]
MRAGKKVFAFASAVAAIAIGIPVAAGSAHSKSESTGKVSHVLLISVDGLHQSDLAWYVQTHPGSELAKLYSGGREYSHAMAPIPTDSFPGMVGQVTGGNPGTTGVYYDAEYNHNLLRAGTTSCTDQKRGAEVNYFEVIAKNPLSLDSGQGLPGLPGSILQLTGDARSLIHPKTLPVDPATCWPVYPHQYLKVNTIFEVIRSHGLQTAWSDKHVAYEILNGPSGKGIHDLFAPEINSNALLPNGNPWPTGGDWTQDNAATMQYDNYKVQAVLNWIDGYNHSRTKKAGVPAILGMNFQTVSTAEKLPFSDGLNGGYLPATRIPGPLLRRALDFINNEVERMAAEIDRQGLGSSTAIIISAKHGQSPQNPLSLTRISDGTIIDKIEAAWHRAHPGTGKLIGADPGNQGAGSRDDAFPLWVRIRTPAAIKFVRDYLWSHSATGNTYNVHNALEAGPPRTLEHSGLARLFVGEAAARYFGTSPADPRHPDVRGVVQHGVVYTGHLAKIAEHGGAGFEDRNVPILVYAPGAVRSGGVSEQVETTQIAPTILQLLGLNPHELKAVRIEGTPVLAGA